MSQDQAGYVSVKGKKNAMLVLATNLVGIHWNEKT